MNNAEIIEHFNNMSNTDVVTNTMAVLNGFIDLRSQADRIAIRTSLSNEGVVISSTICHRDGDE